MSLTCLPSSNDNKPVKLPNSCKKLRSKIINTSRDMLRSIKGHFLKNVHDPEKMCPIFKTTWCIIVCSTLNGLKYNPEFQIYLCHRSKVIEGHFKVKYTHMYCFNKITYTICISFITF